MIIVGKTYIINQFNPLYGVYSHKEARVVNYKEVVGDKDRVTYRCEGRKRTVTANIFKARIVG